jgi:hypothetical protein
MIGWVLLRWAGVHDAGVPVRDMYWALALERVGRIARDGGAKPEYLVVSSEVTLLFTGRQEWE